MTAGRSRESGFTLLELLAGMAIFVLIAGTAYAALSAAGRIWEAVEERARAADEARVAVAYLRRRLAAAFPLAVEAGDGWQVWFEGGRDRVVFLVEGARHVGLAGLHQMTVRHDFAARPPSLELVLQRIDDRLRIGENREQAARRVLIETVGDVDFAYFGRRTPDEEAAWHAEWRDRERLPALVRLRLGGGAIVGWPPVTVRLPADGLRFERSPETEERSHAWLAEPAIGAGPIE